MSVVAVLAHEAALGGCFVSVVAVLAHEAALVGCFVSVVAVLAHEAVALGNDDVRDEAAMARDKQENEFSLEFNK